MLNSNRVPSPGVIVALAATAPPQATTTALLPVDAAVRWFESVSHPGYVIRHQNLYGYLNAIFAHQRHARQGRLVLLHPYGACERSLLFL
jgi:hypothetical protein